MKRIFKYPLKIIGEQEIELPYATKALHVGEQDGKLCLWVITNDNSRAVYSIAIRGTGHIMDGNEGVYLGTVQMLNGLVWHVFHPRYIRDTTEE